MVVEGGGLGGGGRLGGLPAIRVLGLLLVNS